MAVASEALRVVPLFRDLPARSLGRIAAHALPVSYEAGEVVFREGDPGLGFFVLVAGRVSVAHGGKEAAQLAAGGFFGEMALLDSYPRSATVTAVEDTRCLSVKRSDFLRELRDQPDIALEVMAILSKRIRDLDTQIRHLETSLPREWLS